MQPAAAPTQPRGLIQLLLGPTPEFVATPVFDGARAGAVLKLGHCGLGYYRDDPSPATWNACPGAVSLPLADLLVDGGRLETHGSRRRPRAKRRPRRAAATAHDGTGGDPLCLADFRDWSYKERGLWAITTANVTAWASAAALLAEGVTDALLMQ